MKYSKILLCALSISVLVACGNEKQANEKVESTKIEEKSTDKENSVEIEKLEEKEVDKEDKESDSKDDKKKATSHGSDLLVKADYDIFEEDILDIADEDPADLGLVESEKDPDELIDSFFDEDVKNLINESYVAFNSMGEKSGQYFLAAVDYKDDDIYQGHFLDSTYESDKQKSSVEENFFTNNPAYDYNYYRFLENGKVEGKKTPDGKVQITVNPEINQLMEQLKKLSSSIKAYEDKDGKTYLYYKNDPAGKMFDLFKDQFKLSVEGVDLKDLEEKLVVTYEDDDNYPDKFLLSIGKDNIQILINNYFSDYNKVDEDKLKPISFDGTIDGTKDVSEVEVTSTDAEALSNIGLKISSVADYDEAVYKFYDLIDDGKFYDFWDKNPTGSSIDEVDKFVDGYFDKKVIDIKDNDQMVVYKFEEFEDKDMGKVYALDIAVNFYEDKLNLASIQPGYFEVKPEEIMDDKDLSKLQTVNDIDQANVKPLGIAAMVMNKKPVAQIVVPSKVSDGTYRANYLFYVDNQLVEHLYLPFEEASQDFATASNSMFREFVNIILEENQ